MSGIPPRPPGPPGMMPPGMMPQISSRRACRPWAQHATTGHACRRRKVVCPRWAVPRLAHLRPRPTYRWLGQPPGAPPPVSPAVGSAATPILGQGLLAPNSTAYPPPLPEVPGLFPSGMRPTGMELGQEQVLAILLPKRHDDIPDDETEELPGALKPYAAGLRPATRPTGSPWQQEIIYERLGKSDTEIESINRHYFNAAAESTTRSFPTIG